jgi:hypothetical protein
VLGLASLPSSFSPSCFQHTLPPPSFTYPFQASSGSSLSTT